jgi:HD superfamily phosphohydrolase
MSENIKIIRDPIHGNIPFKDYFIDLLETPEIQRLYNVKQLGFAHLVFPGAHHTRLEHSLGVYRIVLQISEVLQLDDDEKELLKCAALLHDIGHGPFSHTLESILYEKFGVDHIDLTENLILGEYKIFQSEEERYIQGLKVNKILENHSIDKKEIIKIIRGKNINKKYLSNILNSTIDADQLDYLIRDAYYTGVSYGLIDIGRLLQTIQINSNLLTFDRKGVGVIENILMARGLMYSSVYFHKTVRIAELMLSKAIEHIPNLEPFKYFKMTDGEILNSLKNLDRFQYEIITRIKYRNLYKQAFAASINDLSPEELSCLKELENPLIRREKELEIENSLNIEKGHLIIDIPQIDLLRAEPRINKTDIAIFDKDKIFDIDNFTPIAKAIKSRIIPDWVIMVITDDKYRTEVSKKARGLLFN